MSLAGYESAHDQPEPPLGSGLASIRHMQLPVTIAGHDLSGLAFVDQCLTLSISPTGAVVNIHQSLANEQEVFIRHADREVLARVVGHPGVAQYELSFLSSNPGFWGAEITASGVEHEGVLQAEFVDDTPTATDPLLVPNYARFEDYVAPKPATQHTERRRSPRISLRHAKACVQLEDGQQEIVELLDVSRGGLCFRTGRVYALQTCIRVSAPFTPGGTNLFGLARIVRIHRDPYSCTYGAEYLR